MLNSIIGLIIFTVACVQFLLGDVDTATFNLVLAGINIYLGRENMKGAK